MLLTDHRTFISCIARKFIIPNLGSSIYGDSPLMLNLQCAYQDGHHGVQSSRIVTKMACWGKEPMERKSLQSYFIWLKERLKEPVSVCVCVHDSVRRFHSVVHASRASPILIYFHSFVLLIIVFVHYYLMSLHTHFFQSASTPFYVYIFFSFSFSDFCINSQM